LVARLENKELHTYRVISDLREHIVSQQSRIDISLVAMSRSLTVLHDRIETIVPNLEILKSSVNSLILQVKEQHEMNSLLPLAVTPLMDVEELLDSPMKTPERTRSPDIRCFETFGLCRNLSHDLRVVADGTSDYQEWENLDVLMKNYQEDISRNPEPNGGTDTSEKRKSSSMISGQEE